MTFHDKAALSESLNERFPPIHDGEFDYFRGRLDEAMALTAKLETIPFTKAKPRKRGILRWFLR